MILDQQIAGGVVDSCFHSINKNSVYTGLVGSDLECYDVADENEDLFNPHDCASGNEKIMTFLFL